MRLLTLLIPVILALRASAAAIPHPKVLVARAYNPIVDLYANWPNYEQLPLHPSFPTKAAWGVWVCLFNSFWHSDASLKF